MNKEQSLALYEKGKDAWNAWAKDMLDKRAALEAAGEWSAKPGELTGNLEGQNEKTKSWLSEAAIDFSGHLFGSGTVFSGFIFPGDVMFIAAEFADIAPFRNAAFLGGAQFSGVTFSYTADFNDSIFFGNAWFNDAKLSKLAAFHRSIFKSGAYFDYAQFGGPINFVCTIFKWSTSFVAIEGKGSFDLKCAEFAQAPDFEQAHFHEAPVLDFTRFADSYDQPPQSIRPKPDRDISPRWRALKRLAIQGHDHQREQLFFANEIVTRRGFEDRPFDRGAGRYWLGLLYDMFSDFGRSTFRPFASWTVITILLAAYYFYRRFGLTNSSAACVGGDRSDQIWAAMYLSFAKGLVVSGIAGSEKLEQVYGCLYGGNGDKAVIPYDVAFLGIGQTLVSAVLIFLALLAIRNRFRIK